MTKSIFALIASLVLALPALSQTPTLALSAAKVGISSNEGGTAATFKFQMEAPGSPGAVTAGESIFTMGSWPNGKNPTFSDDQSNTWATATTCVDSQSIDHGIFYAANVAANTGMITETHSSAIANTVFDWARFYNMSTSPSGFVDGNSCKTVTPTSNTAPNITGTPYTTTANNDLILTCVFDVSSDLTAPNNWNSITYPANSTGLSDEPLRGHACAYQMLATAGSFTPTFTVSQSAHDTFVIVSAAFEAGSGGSAPGTGPSVLLSEMQYVPAAGQTLTINLPCPSATTNITIMDEAGLLNSVRDSGSNSYTKLTSPATPFIFYKNSPTTVGNTFTVSMSFNSGGYSLVGLFCLGNTAAVDTGAATKNNSTLTSASSGSTWNGATESGALATDAPSIGPSGAGDLVMAAGAIGDGPATGCAASSCTFDYVGSNLWSGNGDNQSYSNGDMMGHFYDATQATVDFQWTVVNTGSYWTGFDIAYRPATSQQQGPPVGASNLQSNVH